MRDVYVFLGFFALIIIGWYLILSGTFWAMGAMNEFDYGISICLNLMGILLNALAIYLLIDNHYRRID